MSGERDRENQNSTVLVSLVRRNLPEGVKRQVRATPLSIRDTASATFNLYNDDSLDVEIKDELFGNVTADLSDITTLENIVRLLKGRRKIALSTS